MELQTSGVVVRLVFRIFFTALFFYLNFIGTYCNEFARKRQLLRQGRIRVIETAGWLDLNGLFDGLWNIRRIPNVSWWMIMLLIGALSKLTDFATTAVQQKSVQGSCVFGTGMVLNLTGYDAFSLPPSNGKPTFVAGSAQQTSLANGCSEGIYRKVNAGPSFCAAQSDLLGTWKCQSVWKDITYKYGQYTNYTILHDLLERGLLYENSHVETTETIDPRTFSHLVAWGTSTYDYSNELWDVKASLDLTANNTDNKVMHSMYCTMQASSAEAIMRLIPSVKILPVWGPLLQGYMYSGFSSPAADDPEQTLAQYLNTIIMVAGGSDNLLSTPPGTDATQGCLVNVTFIPWWLIALLFATILACAIMTAWTIYFWSQVRKHKSCEHVKNLPIDLWTWMAQAVAESNGNQANLTTGIEPKDLNGWNVVISDDCRARIERRSDELQPLTGPLTPNEYDAGSQG